jgi:predicted nucleotidyltransferase
MVRQGISISEEKLAAICRQNKIRRLALFGSVLRDDFSDDSDIDVLVEFEPNSRVGLRFFEVERQLSELFGRRVDLNTLGFLGKSFRDEVRDEAEVLYDSAH